MAVREGEGREERAMVDERQLTIADVEGVLPEGWEAGTLFSGEVHEVAGYFRMMTDSELDELGADIKANGLRDPIVLDTQGRLIEGRNRLAACRRAGVEPVFWTLPPDEDPVLFIASKNLQRRDITKGQRAMAIAQMKLFLRNNLRQAQMAEMSGASRPMIAYAEMILEYAPDLVDGVTEGAPTLKEAYEEARNRKMAAEGRDSRLTTLQAECPDLAILVQEERLTLSEAWAAMEKRQREERERIAILTRQLDAVLNHLDPREIDREDYARQWLNANPSLVGEHADFSPARARKAADTLLRYALLKEAEDRG